MVSFIEIINLSFQLSDCTIHSFTGSFLPLDENYKSHLLLVVLRVYACIKILTVEIDMLPKLNVK